MGKEIKTKVSSELTKKEAKLFSDELVNVREEVREDPYLAEALRVLPVKGYRSAIGAY